MRVTDLSSETRFLLVRSRLSHELGPDAACAACGIAEPLVLARVNDSIVCRECEAVRRGASPFQAHHLGGRAPRTKTVLTGANLHAILTQLQECFWRGRHEPGSAYAFAFDLAAYLAYMTGEAPDS
jgi:hypothetical protein